MSLSLCLYVSDATEPISDAMLQNILDRAFLRNDVLGITGVLLYGSGMFVQVMEGDMHSVAELYDIIQGDKRHTNMQRLLFGPIESRLFPNWSMGCLNIEQEPKIDREELQKIVCVRDQSTLSSERYQKKAICILQHFRERLKQSEAA